MRELSVDVECVATGRGHNDRAPCWIAVVDVDGRVLVDRIVKVETMVSPLTQITGLTASDIESRGVTFAEAMQEVRAVLGPDVRLIGQAIQHDIAWLDLKKGEDFAAMVDIAEEFRCYNPKYARHDYFSLAQTAFGLLGVSMHGDCSHSPIEDCRIALRLYCQFIRTGTAPQAARKLQQMRFKKQFPPRSSAEVIDGVCAYKFNRAKCFCGQPTTSFR